MSTPHNILLIGGAGFLGHALSRALVCDGYTVHIVARTVVNGDHEGVRYHRGSQDDSDIILPLLKICETVVHLAANSTPGVPSENVLAELEQNVIPAARLINLMDSAPPSRLIFISSGGSIYGDLKEMPVDEHQHISPISNHAAGKASLEALFTTFAHRRNVSLAILRPSNIYGPGQPLREGFGVVRTILDAALTGRTVEIRGDGTAIRDYLYIDDVVDACISVIENHSAMGLFNVGSGSGVSINSLVNLTRELTGGEIPVVCCPAPRSDVHMVFLDSARLTSTTGWRPLWTLEDGLQKTWGWLKNGN